VLIRRFEREREREGGGGAAPVVCCVSFFSYSQLNRLWVGAVLHSAVRVPRMTATFLCHSVTQKNDPPAPGERERKKEKKLLSFLASNTLKKSYVITH